MSAPEPVDPSTLGGGRRGHRRLPAPSLDRPAPPEQTGPHVCDAGWLPAADGVAPCPVCRPATIRRLQQQREKCRVCRLRLHASLVEAGFRTHPECDPYEGGPDVA